MSNFQNYQAIIFIDFHGVMSHGPHWHSLANRQHPLHTIYKDIEFHVFKNNPSLLDNWLLGNITSEEIHEYLKRMLGNDLDHQLLWETFVNDCEQIDISENILNQLKEMREHYRIILITDNMDSFNRFTIPKRAQELAVFDDIVNSSSEKRTKIASNCASFLKYINKYGANQSQCLLIDDSVNNCAAFEKNIASKSYCLNNEQDILATLNYLHRNKINALNFQA